MRKPSSRTTSHKRAPRQPRHDLAWVYVEPVLTPMMTPEQVAAADAAEPVPPPATRFRQPRQCRVGYGYQRSRQGSPLPDQRVPTLRLSGAWLEQIGFGIGCTLKIIAREGEVVVIRVGEN